jgi:hypothetical protein
VAGWLATLLPRCVCTVRRSEEVLIEVDESGAVTPVLAPPGGGQYSQRAQGSGGTGAQREDGGRGRAAAAAGEAGWCGVQ